MIFDALSGAILSLKTGLSLFLLILKLIRAIYAVKLYP